MWMAGCVRVNFVCVDFVCGCLGECGLCVASRCISLSSRYLNVRTSTPAFERRVYVWVRTRARVYVCVCVYVLLNACICVWVHSISCYLL